MATTREQLVEAVSSLGFYEAVVYGYFDSVAAKSQIAFLTPVSTADATDEATAIVLVNALKVKVNDIIAALKA